MSTRILIAIALAALLAVVALHDAPSAARPEPPATVRPRVPPGPDDRHPVVAEPSAPALTPEVRAVLATAARGADRPGMAAFRKYSDLYVDANRELLRAQMAAEKLSEPELRELTTFGLLVMATQRAPEVEDMLGHPLEPDDLEALATLMRSANDDFKARMRALVADGADPRARWALIRETEEAYLASFYRITGMTEELLDDMLAGRLGLEQPLPDGPVEQQPYEPPRPRP